MLSGRSTSSVRCAQAPRLSPYTSVVRPCGSTVCPISAASSCARVGSPRTATTGAAPSAAARSAARKAGLLHLLP